MTDLELACLRVIRIEGPIGGFALAQRLGLRNHDGAESLGNSLDELLCQGLIQCDGTGRLWDVTPRGRMKFTALHRPKTILARLKARAGWRK